MQSLSENEASSSALNFSDEFLLQGRPASRVRSCDINVLSAIVGGREKKKVAGKAINFKVE